MPPHSVRYRVLCFLVFLLLQPPLSQAETYQIDRHHSTVAFDIRHLFSSIHGRFKHFEGQIEHIPDNPPAWSVQAQINAASVHTKNYQRDRHIRSEDFLDAENFPSIVFKSTEIESAGPGHYRLKGMLHMHGVERPVALDLKFEGEKEDERGRTRAVFQATAELSRKDFGIDWNVLWDTGDFLLSDKVKVTLDIEAVRIQGEVPS